MRAHRFPGLLSAFFLLTAIDCNALWGLTWLVVGPVLFGGVLIVLLRDGERCLIVGLAFQGLGARPPMPAVACAA